MGSHFVGILQGNHHRVSQVVRTTAGKEATPLGIPCLLFPCEDSFAMAGHVGRLTQPSEVKSGSVCTRLVGVLGCGTSLYPSRDLIGFTYAAWANHMNGRPIWVFPTIMELHKLVVGGLPVL